MGTRLKRIVLKGFRSIREVDIELRSINLLIGANGAGKSNFLGFFSFMRQIVKKGLQSYVVDRGGPDRLLHFGRKTTPAVGYQIEFEGGFYEGRLLATTSNQLRFVEERCRRTDGHASDPGVVELGFGGGLESRIPSHPSDSLLGLIYSHIDSWRVYHFHDTTSTAGVKLQSSVADNVALHADASNLAAFLLRIQGTANYELIVRTVRQVAPFFEDFVLEPEDSASRFVRLRWSHRGTDRIFDAFELSDGTLRFICLATVLLQPALPELIVLDEPELGLHPYALSILAGLMRAVPSSTQIVAATQSVTLVNQFDLDDIVIVDRSDESTMLRRPSLDELDAWLGEYGIGDLWEKNVIGGTPR